MGSIISSDERLKASIADLDRRIVERGGISIYAPRPVGQISGSHTFWEWEHEKLEWQPRDQNLKSGGQRGVRPRYRPV